mgnify:CR=1 FL=1
MKTTIYSKLTEELVLDFLHNLSVFGDSTIYCSIGPGASGLDVTIDDITPALVGMTFDGQVEPCDDLKSCGCYPESEYAAYQWSDKNGFKFQVLVG